MLENCKQQKKGEKTNKQQQKKTLHTKIHHQQFSKIVP